MRIIKAVQDQSTFCLDLMRRLNDDIHNAEVEYGMITNHTRMENDVVRLRRELVELRYMLENYGYER